MAKTTTCSICGKKIKYKTKKPKKCSSCSMKTVYKKKKKNKEDTGSRSKLEFKVQIWLNELFPEPQYHYIANGYYSWIISPKGYPLQLDFLIYEKGHTLFAIEVQGQQHFKKAYNQTQQQFDYLMDCDIIKERTLKKKKIPLISINYKEKMTKEEFIAILKNELGSSVEL